MEFKARTSEEILEEIYSWSSSQESKVEGVFTFDCFSTNSIEFMKVENELAEAYNANFGQTSWSEYLTMRAAEHGVIRREANKAIGQLTITGTGTIPAGSLFATEAGTRFVATTTTTITGSGTIDIIAQKGGDIGNVAANTITKIPLSIPGITACTNDAPTYDGYDEEDDDTLRERFLDKVRQPATSGNPYEYVQWALSVVGVGAARCVRTPYGPGTVEVVIVDSNFEAANPELLERVNDYLQSQRPVGIFDGDLHVVSAQPKAINISADIHGSIDMDGFREGLQTYFSKVIKKNLDSYQTSSDGGLISVAQVASVIIVEGGAENFVYDSLTVNGGHDDIALDIKDLPTIGEIDFY